MHSAWKLLSRRKGARQRRSAGGLHLFWVAAWLFGLGLVPARPLGAADALPAFSFQALRERARSLAAQAYKEEASAPMPDFLKKLSYNQYQDIRFRPEHGPWSQERLRFDLEYFHRGYLYADPVRLRLIEAGQVRDVSFSPQQFDYGKNYWPVPLPGNLGFAGFRVVYLPNVDQRQARTEIASFLGASYYRLAGTRQRYGASSRGLAIDTGEPTGEEFPRFTEFWIEKPGEAATYLQCDALLNSPSSAGAFHFLIKPGEETVAEVEAHLFVRQEKKFGLAPLTSMFLVGENRTGYVPDFRPEVHDSDGLLMQTAAGEWLWRPLLNPPKKHRITRFPVAGLRGFGLMQRDREFHNYEDLAARYELRPGLWVQPQSNWGTGVVELVEIPSPNEFNDNIVAYWVPGQKPAPGQELSVTYKLSALSAGPDQGALARVTATRINPQQDKLTPRFVVDFSGESLPVQTAAGSLQARVQTSRGEIQHLSVQKNEVTGGWRVVFDLANAGSEPATLRLHLHQGGQPLSETWVYDYQFE